MNSLRIPQKTEPLLGLNRVTASESASSGGVPPSLPSGEVSVEREYLTYVSPFGHAWSVPLSAIALVGRVSTLFFEGAPERFLVVAFRDRSWYAIPEAAEGLAPSLDALGRFLGLRRLDREEPDRVLNEVVWPPSLAGNPLFGPVHGSALRQASRHDGRELTPLVLAFLDSGPVALGQVS
jgi:hypothetical protein